MLVIGLIIAAFVAIIKFIWPYLLAVAIIVLISYLWVTIRKRQRQKEEIKKEQINNLTNQLKTLDRLYNDSKVSLQLDPHQPFVKSLSDQLPFEIDIIKAKLGRIEGLLSLEEEQSIIETSQKAIDDYILVDDTVIDPKRNVAFQNLNTLLSSPIIVRLANKLPDIYTWSSEIKRQNANFTPKYFKKVIPSDSSDVFAIICNDITYYFYPDCIVESKSDYDFKVHKYADVPLRKKKVSVVENNQGIPGAKVIGETYLHTRVGGGPDLRYNYNPHYDIYEYYYLYNIKLPFFVLETGDETFATKLQQVFHKLAHIAQSNTNIQDVTYNNDSNEKSLADSNNTKNDYHETKEDISLIETMQSIIKHFGEDVILEKRFIYMLDDYKVFKDVPYFMNIMKLVQSEEAMKEIVEQESWNNKCLAIVDSLSQKYMLKEDAVKRVLKDIVLAINVCRNYGFRENLVRDSCLCIVKTTGIDVESNRSISVVFGNEPTRPIGDVDKREEEERGDNNKYFFRNAIGHFNAEEGTFIINRGSLLENLKWRKGKRFSKNNLYRKSVIDKYCELHQSGFYLVLSDIICPTPSEAAFIVSGVDVNGLEVWKDINGNTLKQCINCL